MALFSRAEREILEGPLNLVEQEFRCSFSEAVAGATYGREMAEAETQGRICPVPHQPRRPVTAAYGTSGAVHGDHTRARASRTTSRAAIGQTRRAAAQRP